YYNPDDEAPVEKNDPRVTPIGRFLRHSSIDELPQIFNVFIGQMSIVGPRPHMVSHTEHYQPLIAKYMLRHSVKPGITGWAQVNGFRGSTDKLWKMERRVEHDVWYIENWSFMLDIKIIARTLINIFQGDENAF
ncbi:MAG: sugar transferase, partial [Paramuribaculum sp.]|nr:sugar transferase [Paramuribaculum sp.]